MADIERMITAQDTSAETVSPPALKSSPARRTPARKLPVVPARFAYHRLRKTAHLVCFAVFLALPFFNVMRFDIPRQRFYFAGQELWINEFGIVFFALMFLLFLVVAASMFYGRVYCGYLCPQMIFSEASIAAENKLRKLVNKRLAHWEAKHRRHLSRALFLLALGIASVFLAFVFISYFVEPRDLFRRLLSFDIRTAGGIAGAATTLITFLDFTFVRERFCTTACPYGYLQGMLSDANTLIVHYRDEAHDCIECKKCVRVCEMGIDIRNSPYQLECIHCGECIDACVEVLGRLGKPGLIHYTWGERGELLADKTPPWYRRLGLRDTKRAVVLLLVLFYASGLYAALSMRRSVLARVSPDRAELYWQKEDGRILNKFHFTLANRGRQEATVSFSIENLGGAQLLPNASPIRLKSGTTEQGEFEVAASRGMLPPGVSHFQIVVRVEPNGESERFEQTFIMPAEKREP